MIALRCGSATHTGQVRSINQDSALVADNLFAVADGMGGHAAGEVASQVAVEALRTYAEPTVEGMVKAVRLANRAVWARADDDPELRGMGTTLTTLALVTDADEEGTGQDGTAHADGATTEDVVVVTNVGDSRAYLFRSGDLTQLTDDHSLVGDLEREGRITSEEARHHPQRNIVTRVLGNEPDVQVDRFRVAPLKGDRFVLCSDGLFSEVDDDRIAAVLRRLADPNEASRELVRLANDEGGRDNITVVVVDVVDDGGKAEAASSALADDRPSTAPRTAVVAPVAVPSSPDVDDDHERPRLSRAERRKARPRRLTWRSALFVLIVLGVLGGAGAAVAWFSRSTFFVGIQGDQVVIFRGRPDGVLWIEPTFEEDPDLALDDVPDARLDDLRDGKEEPTLGDARRYVENLRRQGQEGQAQTPDTSTTSTTSSSTSTTR